MKLYSDLECLSPVSAQEVMKIYLNHKDALSVHVDFYSTADEGLEMLEEIKTTEPTAYKKLVVSCHVCNLVLYCNLECIKH